MFRNFSFFALLIFLSISLNSCDQLGLSKKDNNNDQLVQALIFAQLSSSFNCEGCTCVTTASTSGGPSCQTCFSSEIPSWMMDNFTCISAYKSGNQYIVNTTDQPPHKSAYYGASSPYFEAMPGGNTANPNTIKSQNITLKIPVTPTLTSSTASAGLGPVGVATNGIVIYNNEAGPGDSLANEYTTFDAAEGHPQMSGQYHYHTEPIKLTVSDSNFIGVMLDGYPVYGKKDQTNAFPTLDSYGTRTCVTTHFPSGTQCYHVRNGTGVNGFIISSFRGVKGTVSQ